MRLKLVSCEVYTREMCSLIAKSPHEIDVEFLPKGLHDLGGPRMSAKLAERLATIDESIYDAVLLGFCLCGNGIHGLRAGSIPLVVPRGHDCMSVFFGGIQRHVDHLCENPHTYYLTSGWIERGKSSPPPGTAAGGAAQTGMAGMMGGDRPSFEEMAEIYGEENAADILREMYGEEGSGRFTYIEMGVEPDDRFEKETRRRAEQRQWGFEKVRGTLRTIEKFLFGEWDEATFLVCPPGHRIEAAPGTPGLIRAVPCPDTADAATESKND